MPRLTNHHYLKHRHFLVMVIREVPGLYLSLTPAQQWNLHGYFQLTATRSDHDLLMEGRDLTKSPLAGAPRRSHLQADQTDVGQSHLHSKGDRTVFDDVVKHLTGLPANAQREGERLIYVRGEVNPTIDTQVLARALAP